MRLRRERRGLSQAQLAEALEVSRRTIISIEKGVFSPSLPLAFRIAEFFSVTIEEVFAASDATGIPPAVRDS
ncbi:helix-turn-helix transcriptional regulator [Mycetocola tolaasinivorans]|uniref:helix-turn-helix transcriptional regulator n=1 Tax=Mycetocola tolaasinivorans TaxID=76635 RepID=UPI003CCC8BBE